MFLEETLQSIFSPNPTFSNPFRLCLSGGNTIENPEDNCLRQCSANLVIAQGQFAAFALHCVRHCADAEGFTRKDRTTKITENMLQILGISRDSANGLPWGTLCLPSYWFLYGTSTVHRDATNSQLWRLQVVL